MKYTKKTTLAALMVCGVVGYPLVSMAAGQLGIDSSPGTDMPLGASGVEAMVLGGGNSVPAGSVQFLGKIGVGTAQPTSAMTISDGGYYGNIWLGKNNADTSKGDLTFDGGADNIFLINNVGASTGRTSFTYNGAERMIVSNAGGVGIGTSAPMGSLDIAASGGNSGPAFYVRETKGIYGTLRFTNQAGNNYIESGLTTAAGSQAPLLFTGMNGYPELMRISATGSVGIGTSAPDFGLTVEHSGGRLALNGWGKGISIPAGNALAWKGNGSSGNNTLFMAFPSSNPAGYFYEGFVNGTEGNSWCDYILYINGNSGESTFGSFQFTRNLYAPNVLSPSDERLKKDVVAIPDALAKLEKLRGVTFFWKDASKSTDRQAGVIAQEIEKVLPEVVFKDDAGMLSVDYSKLTPLLIEAVKDMKKDVDALREWKSVAEKQAAQIEKQEAALQALQKKVESLSK